MPTEHQPVWKRLGAHVDGGGVRFGVWAPRAVAVSVVGDFCDWDPRAHPLARHDDGAWNGTVPGIGAGELYQFAIRTGAGWTTKSDPLARSTQLQPQRSSIVHESTYVWADDAWMTARADRQPHLEPMSTYEVHLGSWRRGLSYRQLAAELVPYVSDLGFTHVELMPVTEHPFLGSWGYQVSGYFAPTSRHGRPDDFRALVDAFHCAGIAVVLDWVPGHFPRDEWALARFDGHPLYEHGADVRHTEWDTLSFDFDRPEVREFLVSSALFWLEEFHVDGLRVDAVAQVVRPERLDGEVDEGALAFLRELNATCYARNPGIVMIAEDSEFRPGITTPVHLGGLGFGFSWCLGWMHDTLRYLYEDPLWRQNHHDDLTRTMRYVHAANAVLPLSHDEVSQGKGSLVSKMPGDAERRRATLRAVLALQWAHPGKKLLFMGGELGQEREWSARRSLDWDEPGGTDIQALVADLNAVYTAEPAWWRLDHDPAGFSWIAEHDRHQNVAAFARHDQPHPDEPHHDRQSRTVVCVSSFAGIDQTYRLGLPHAGRWVTILDTSAARYGGPGAVGPGVVDARAVPHHGLAASAEVQLPALTTLWLTLGEPT